MQEKTGQKDGLRKLVHLLNQVYTDEGSNLDLLK